MTIRRLLIDDVAQVVRNRSMLFPDCPALEQRREVEAYLNGTPEREPLGAKGAAGTNHDSRL